LQLEQVALQPLHRNALRQSYRQIAVLPWSISSEKKYYDDDSMIIVYTDLRRRRRRHAVRRRHYVASRLIPVSSH